jgi:hypothetical protein
MVFLRYLVFHILMVTHPLPLHAREMAHVLNTERLLSYGDLYQLTSLPVYTNVYGFGYNIFSIPLSLIFGVSLLAHRFTNMIFMMGSALLIFQFCRKRSVSPLISAWAGILFYLIQCNSYAVAASPDMVGLFFMLLSFTAVDRLDFRISRLLGSLLFAGIALLVKPYFVFAMPCVALSIFANESKWKGIFFLAIGITIFSTELLLLQWFFPFSFFSVFEIHYLFKTHVLDFLVRQSLFFSLYHAGLILIFLFVIVDLFIRNGWRFLPDSLSQINRLRIRGPLLKVTIDTHIIAVFSALLVLYFSLGWHGGAFLIYFFQLLTPFLIVSVVTLQTQSIRHQWIVITGMALNTALLFFFSPISPRINVGNLLQNERLFRTPDINILATPHFNNFLRKHGHTIYDNGESEYVIHSAIGLKSIDATELHDRVVTYLVFLNRKIGEQKFDIIITSQWSMPYLDKNLLEQRYKKSGVLLCDWYYGAFTSPLHYGKTSEPLTVWIPIYPVSD